jgi:glycosyltransferase involved in cell wall biosynthesis
MNVLITHPEFESQGGVSNLYKRLQNKFKMPIVYFIVGKRTRENGFLSRLFRIFLDYVNFVKCLKINKIDLVHINPSLDLKSFLRDGFLAFLARINKKKTVVFFHGWQKSFEVYIDRNFVWIFKFFFGKSDAFIVLSDEFRKTLERWGIVQPIYKGVTVIDEDDLSGFNIQIALKKRQSSESWRVLFLSRIVKDKGIYETIEAVSLLKAKYPMIELIVAGEGKELENVKCLVQIRKMSNVTFMGYVRDKKKRDLFEKSHVFCFPTYSEGLPISVIEAIAYGLPVVTRPVGGLAEFFENEKHGFITKSKEPIVFAKYIEKLFLDKKLYKNISYYNFSFGKEWFSASKLVRRLEEIYSKVLSLD